MKTMFSSPTKRGKTLKSVTPELVNSTSPKTIAARLIGIEKNFSPNESFLDSTAALSKRSPP